MTNSLYDVAVTKMDTHGVTIDLVASDREVEANDLLARVEHHLTKLRTGKATTIEVMQGGKQIARLSWVDGRVSVWWQMRDRENKGQQESNAASVFERGLQMWRLPDRNSDGEVFRPIPYGWEGQQPLDG